MRCICSTCLPPSPPPVTFTSWSQTKMSLTYSFSRDVSSSKSAPIHYFSDPSLSFSSSGNSSTLQNAHARSILHLSVQATAIRIVFNFHPFAKWRACYVAPWFVNVALWGCVGKKCWRWWCPSDFANALSQTRSSGILSKIITLHLHFFIQNSTADYVQSDADGDCERLRQYGDSKLETGEEHEDVQMWPA
jgi:hypothetical protein